MANRIITTNIQPLVEEVNFSNLNTAVSSASSTITVYSIVSFSTNQVLIIGEPGSAGSEIILTHASTSPTGNTVTLASNTTKAHPKDDKVYIVNYNQIEFSHADTEAGAKSVLSTATINPELVENFYQDISNSAGYYFTRFKNSITSVFSAYSDPIPYGGFDNNTVGYAIDTAMTELNAKYSDKLTFEMLIGFSKQMLRLVRGKMKSWANYQEFGYNLGTMSMGARKFTLPSTIYDNNSDRSILNVFIGDGTPLTYIDRSEYLQAIAGRVYTEVATEGAVSATSLVLDDTSDLPSSGSIDVYVSGTKYTIEYTVNTKSTNTLTVASDQITVTLPVDSEVWYNVLEGDPEYYSVWDGDLYVWPMVNSDYEGENITIDFYTDIEDIDSQGDVINGVKFDMLIPYLKYKIRAVTENNGTEDLEDPSFQEFRELLNDAMKNNRTAEINSFRPRSKAIYQGSKHNSRR